MNLKKCKSEALINGVWIEFDFQASNINAYDKEPVFKQLEYLGHEFEERYDGVIQDGYTCDHIWRLKE